jgi:hypothetical protein
MYVRLDSKDKGLHLMRALVRKVCKLSLMAAASPSLSRTKGHIPSTLSTTSDYGHSIFKRIRHRFHDLSLKNFS